MMPLVTRLNLVSAACAAGAAASAAAFGLSPLSVGIPAALFVGLCADGILRPGSSLVYPTRSHGPRDGDRVALTFDDGPDPEVTPHVLDALVKYDTRATFFVIGRSVLSHPSLVQEIAAAGHELGNHSWRHGRFSSFLSVAAQEREIRRGAAAIAAVTGRRAPLYRPPVGLKSPPFARAAYGQRLSVVTWSLRSNDTLTADPERIARRVLSRIRAGDIVLLHDGHDLPGRHRMGAARALPRILAGLRDRGLRGVTVSDLLFSP